MSTENVLTQSDLTQATELLLEVEQEVQRELLTRYLDGGMPAVRLKILLCIQLDVARALTAIEDYRQEVEK